MGGCGWGMFDMKQGNNTVSEIHRNWSSLLLCSHHPGVYSITETQDDNVTTLNVEVQRVLIISPP